MADRFYGPGPWTGGVVVLDGDEARHLAKVRRVGPGAVVEVFDGRGRVAEATVVEIGRDRVRLAVVAERPGRGLVGPLVLATAAPKGDRLDWLVEKATELGVSRLVPLITGRSVVDPRPAKIDRLRRAVVEASKQSGRDTLMAIDPPTPLDAWLASAGAGAGACYLAHPSGRPPAGLAPPDPRRGIALAIGPEGGFTDDEVARAERLGFATISLGPTTLRVETAALAGCAVLLALARLNDEEVTG